MGESDNLFVIYKQFSTPAPISSLAFGHASHLFAGSDDGSLRVYDLSTFKVVKAVRALGDVSAIVCMKRPGSELRDAWIAHGTQISNFQLDSPKMIQTADDALKTIKLGKEDDDVVNELALNTNKTHLAFGMDSGDVGVVDLATNAVTKMKKSHESICGSVKFVLDRREIISAGFDTALLHFDFLQGDLLSERKMSPYAEVSGMSLSPPFIMATSVSPSGVLAAGTADGRLWVGFAGEKKQSGKGTRKKSKKWEGLNEDESLLIKVAEGPIVALSFSEARILSLSTLLGSVTQYELIYDDEDGNVILKQLWQGKCKGVDKVNTLIVDEKRIIVGGLTEDGKGAIDVWKRNLPVATDNRPDVPKV